MKYNNISVRDENSANIVKTLIDCDQIDIVLDPALVWNFEDDSNVIIPTYEDYIAVYTNYRMDCAVFADPRQKDKDETCFGLPGLWI